MAITHRESFWIKVSWILVLFFLLASTVSFASIEVYFSPSDSPEKFIVEELGQALSSVDVAMFYFTNESLANALIEARSRGIKVRVYLDKKQRGLKSSQSRYLAENQIEVRYSSGKGTMNHKFCIIDKKVVITGSYNWTLSAEEKNNENLLIIKDPVIASRYEEEFEMLWNKK